MEHNLLSILIFLPLIGAVTCLLWPSAWKNSLKSAAVMISLIEFSLSLLLLVYFDPATYQVQLTQKIPWIQQLGTSYFVGIDGISLWLVLLTTFLTPIVIFSATVTQYQKAYLSCFLLLETAMMGAFLSLDIILFYVFWELMLVPMYFIIGVWGGARRIYATLKFFIYTFAGGVFMLLSIIFLVYFYHAQFGTFSTSLLDLYSVRLPYDSIRFINPQNLLFLAFAVAFMIKVPMFPFHTWLPDAHVEAPTGGSVILAGVLLKMGAYGFLRFAMPLFPESLKYFSPWLIALALVGVIYGACLALAQKDLKKLVAYSSISHMGIVMLGLFVLTSNGVTGGIFQMLSHGLSTGALFMIVGMIYDRRHTKEIAAFGGLTKVMPRFAVFFLIVTLSSIALPTTNGFIGEFLILTGSFERQPIYAILGGTTVILGAYYMLWTYQRVMFGPIRHSENKGLLDLNWQETVSLIPIIVFIFWMGIYPKTFLKPMEKSVDYLIEHYERYELGIVEKTT